MEIGKLIKAFREKQNMSQRQFATSCGVSNGYISMLEEGKNPKTNEPIVPSVSTMKKIATAIGISLNELMDAVDEMDISIIPEIRPIMRKRLPMLGNVACGEPIWAEEEHDAYVMTDASVDADFTLIAKGDSMINARIFDGDILFVKKTEIVADGEIAVVLVDNEATVKRVYYDRDNNVMTLMPENPTHKPMRFEGSKLDEICILGKVVAGQFGVI
ncbi:MAG: helix-turn-helix domain-containing protein [Clostridia bacterium]|nr:helix-turn-helix domain-containing protein [Clostridia bacterium]